MPNKSSRRPDKVRKPIDGDAHTSERSFETTIRDDFIAVQDLERRRIARDLHDSLGQKVSALKLTLDHLARSPNHSSETKTFPFVLKLSVMKAHRTLFWKTSFAGTREEGEKLNRFPR